MCTLIVERVIPNSLSADENPPFSTTVLNIRSKRRSYSVTGLGMTVVFLISFTSLKHSV